jgi:hypothetical protein
MSLLGAAQFSHSEKSKFLAKIRKEMDKKHISLDALY